MKNLHCFSVKIIKLEMVVRNKRLDLIDPICSVVFMIQTYS